MFYSKIWIQAHGCKTQHMPWADGTPCGEGKSLKILYLEIPCLAIIFPFNIYLIHPYWMDWPYKYEYHSTTTQHCGYHS